MFFRVVRLSAYFLVHFFIIFFIININSNNTFSNHIFINDRIADMNKSRVGLGIMFYVF